MAAASLTEEPPRAPNAIVIAIDRLGSGYLGPYGNTWIDTPVMNQLASEGILFEHPIADSNDLELLYRSYWSGVHAICRQGRTDCSLARLIERAGGRATLITDDDALLRQSLAQDFGEHVALVQPACDRLATSIAETRFAQLALAAIERLADATEPGLLWLHSQGMNGPWDAPHELAERFRDEDDPPAYSAVAPPRFVLERDHDPDDVLRVMHAYAAQVAVIDTCLGSLLDAIQRHPLAADTLLVLTSPRGYPLGEHGRIGPGPGDLFGETLNVPLLIRPPARDSDCMRLAALAQPTDMYATLATWFGLDDGARSSTGHDLLALSRNERAWTREAAFSKGNGEHAVRTPAWSLHLDAERARALYAKPDDRWEINEVADRCGEVPDQLAALLDEFEKLVNQGSPVNFEPLPRLLVEGIE